MAGQPDGLNLTRIKTELEIRELVHFARFPYQIDHAIVAIGVTGTGKSTLLNMLAGKEVFRAAGGIKGCTKGVQKEVVKFQDRSVALIDTPGLLDPETLDKAISQGAKSHVLLSQQSAEFEAHLEEALHKAGEKIDAFLLVFNAESRWSVEAEWVIEILNTLGMSYNHMIAVFTHGDALAKTKEERYKQMDIRLSDARAEVYKLKDLMRMIESRWIITESKDASMRSSGNSEVWDEMLQKLKTVKAMRNEDFNTVQKKMDDEEEMRRSKNATLKEIEQKESELREIHELQNEINRCEPENVKLRQKLNEQVKEAGFTADSDLASFSAKHDEMLLNLQEKREELKNLQSKYEALNKELGSRASEEAAQSRQELTQANEAKLDKAREYWPQYMNSDQGSETEGDEGDERGDGNEGDERDDGDERGERGDGDEGDERDDGDTSDAETETSESPEAKEAEKVGLLS